MQKEFQAMLKYLQGVPGVRAIEVEVDLEANLWDEASVILGTHQDDPGPGGDPVDRAWGSWFLETFPADVCRHFVRLPLYGAADGR